MTAAVSGQVAWNFPARNRASHRQSLVMSPSAYVPKRFELRRFLLSALQQEQVTVRRFIDRYFAAFEEGSMSPATCQKRIEALESQLDALIAEEQALETQEQASAPPSPEIKELRVMSRNEILPTYRIPWLVAHQDIKWTRGELKRRRSGVAARR
jgi:exonuclease VII small subunit